jgi:hypothetical protein
MADYYFFLYNYSVKKSTQLLLFLYLHLQHLSKSTELEKMVLDDVILVLDQYHNWYLPLLKVVPEWCYLSRFRPVLVHNWYHRVQVIKLVPHTLTSCELQTSRIIMINLVPHKPRSYDL